jgi:drug/metabolite transporter (DMT)-like permease
MGSTQGKFGAGREEVMANIASPPAAAHSYRGLLLFMLGVFLFACMDSTTKYLVAHYKVPLVVAIRYIGNCLLMIILLAPSQGRELIRTKRTSLVLVRGACLATASLCVASALQRMPIAEATSIVFLSPLLVLLLAGLVLGERVGALGWIAALMGFAGVLLIARPGSGLDPMGTVFALGAVVSTAAYQLLSRVLVTTERTVPMLFYTALVGSIVFGLFMPWSWGGEAPSALQMLLFLGTGAMGGLGHFLFTAAHRDAPASLLAPMMYVQLLWAGLLGWIVFDHVPGSTSIIGMCTVAAAGAIVAVKSHLNRRIPAEPLE